MSMPTGITAHEIMHSPVKCAQCDTPLSELHQRIVTEHVSAIPIVEGEKLVGIISRSDFVRLPILHQSLAAYIAESGPLTDAPPSENCEAGWMQQLTARDVMAQAVITCAPEDSLEQVASAMAHHHVHRVIVVEEGRPMGMVSSLDIARLVGSASGGAAKSAALVQGGQQRVAVFSLPDDPHAIRDALVDALGLQPIDAQAHARNLPGLLPDHLSREAADLLVEKIQKYGVIASVVSEEAVPDLGHAKTIHHLRMSDAGIEVVGNAGSSEECIPWDALFLLDVGDVPIEGATFQRVEATTVSATARRLAPTGPGPSAPVGLEAWLIAKDPWRGYRIDHSLMNYEYLGERLTENTRDNFRLLLTDLRDRAGNAHLTQGVRGLLDDGPSSRYWYASSEALRRHTLFCLLVIGRLGET